MTESKPFWASKTLWANGLAFLASVAMAAGFDLGLTAEAQAEILVGIMAVVNIGLRIVTGKRIAVSRSGVTSIVSLVAALGIMAALSACAALPGAEAYAAEAVRAKISYNDSKARALKIAVCDISIGAYHRALSQAERDAVMVLCGGARSVTAQDVITLRELAAVLQSEIERNRLGGSGVPPPIDGAR